LAEICGLEPEEILGRTDEELFSAEVAAALRADDRQVLEAGTALEFEEVVPRPNGPLTSIAVKFPLFDEAGAAYAVCGLCTDITERKRLERALAEALRERRAIMDAVPDLLYVLDLDGRLVRWNRRVEEVTGLSPEELYGRSA